MSASCIRVAVASIVCLVPAALGAEPITFTYQITNLVRCEGVSSPVCQPLDQTFPFRMTIDSVPIVTGDDTVTYGEPRFSSVPLLPAIPATADRILSATEHFSAIDTDEFEVLSLALQLYLMNNQLWTVQLAGSELAPIPFPGFTATSFARSMDQFLYDFLTGPEVEIQYRGTATLVDTQPVPEPASLVLFGSSLCALALRRRRSASRRRG